MKNITKKIIITLTICTLFLELVNIYFLNKISTDSIYVTEIKGEIQKYEEINTRAKNAILGYTSLITISSKAKQLGFGESKELVLISSPLQISFKQDNE